MPWSNQSGGGSGGGGDGGGGWKGGGPWGQGSGGRGGGGGGGGGNNQQPDLEEILKRGQDRLKQALPGGGLPGPAILLIGALAAALAGFYAFAFTVKPDELGVVLRLGEEGFGDAPQFLRAHARRVLLQQLLAIDQPFGLRVTADQRGGEEHETPSCGCAEHSKTMDP